MTTQDTENQAGGASTTETETQTPATIEGGEAAEGTAAQNNEGDEIGTNGGVADSVEGEASGEAKTADTAAGGEAAAE